MRRQRGMAVIAAILVVALVAGAASFMAWQQQLWVRQVENLNEQAQSRVVVLAALQWARSVLAQDARNNAGSQETASDEMKSTLDAVERKIEELKSRKASLAAQVRGHGAACLLVTHSRAAAARADRVLELRPDGLVAVA